MKFRKTNTAIAVALLASSGPLYAAGDRGVYLGIGAGQSELESQVVTSSVPPQTVTIKGTGTSVRVFGGYRMIKYLFIEAGASTYGDFSEPIPGTNDTFEGLSSGWDIAIVGNLPLAQNRFDLFAKLGVARTRYETLINDPDDATVARDSRTSQNQNTAMFGVGAQWNLGESKNFGLRLEYNVFDVSLLAVDQSNILGSLVYRF